ncbi:MAG: hypothetical protein KGS61_14030, partial [Verrucomicrobia bacterium]|nr:hypothetical protein [Verrucomicrobiota bacterium]
VDQDGEIVASTLPQSFPAERVEEIGGLVIGAFKGAQAADLPLGELTIHFAALNLTARPLRGGAIIFLTPRT